MLSLVWLIAACGSPADNGAGPDNPTGRADSSETATPSSSPPEASAPSFDCSAVDTDAEKLVCTDAELAGLDRRLAGLYRDALAAPGADAARLEAQERGWAAGRDDCWKADDLRQCVLEAYQTRLVELQIDRPATVAPPAVEYRCDDSSKPVSGVFYNDVDPAAMVLRVGDDQAILLAQPTGSGIRYTRDGASYAEHQGAVEIEFYGTRLACTPA